MVTKETEITTAMITIQTETTTDMIETKRGIKTTENITTETITQKDDIVRK